VAANEHDLARADPASALKPDQRVREARSRQSPRHTRQEATEMATPESRGGSGGLTLGGILVIIGIVLALFVSTVLGVIVILIGLIAFGGFARGKWY
jgi:uncharacterized membrane protein